MSNNRAVATMTNDTGRNARTKRATRAPHLSAILCLAAGLAGCGGGHGGGAGGDQNVSLVHVNSIDPASGPFIGGSSVTIHGASFLPPAPATSTVSIGGKPCTDVVIVDDATITCTTPAGTPGMTVDVVVTNPIGEGRLTNGFRYFSAAPNTSDLNHDGIADLVSGAPLDSTAGAEAGAVFVFFGSSDPAHLGDHDTAHADVKIVGENPGDNFGSSVCTGDVNGDHIDDLIVGADLADQPNAIAAGVVYVFYGPFTGGTTLSAATADVKLTGETTVPGDRFGSAVDMGDIDGDGKAEIMVSAPRHDTSAGTPNAVLDTGCVYVFHGGASLESQAAAQAQMKFGGAAANDQLGASVGCVDLNHDGIEDLVLGCPLADPMGLTLMPNAGVVYVMWGGASLSGAPMTAADLVFTGEAQGDEFGTSLAAGDVNGDGIDDLIVGAPLNSFVDANAGRVYVFFGAASIASKSAQLADVKLSGLPTHDSFGTSVIAGDVDGDGVADILIGAPHADYLNDGNGRAYLFRGGPSLANGFATDAYLMFDGENVQDDGLGSALSLADMNGDGRADMVCAAARNSGGAGRVYMFLATDAAGQHLAVDADAKYSGVQGQLMFGTSIARGQ
jgi:hypothetical protein